MDEIFKKSATAGTNGTLSELPYAGVDLRRLPWPNVIEILEKQADAHKIYQFHMSRGSTWDALGVQQDIKRFNTQFRIAMDHMLDPKHLPCYTPKTWRYPPPFSHPWKKKPVPNLIAQPLQQKKKEIPVPRPVYPTKINSTANAPPQVPNETQIVAKFKIERRMDGNSEIFDLTTDQEYEKSATKSYLKPGSFKK